MSDVRRGTLYVAAERNGKASFVDERPAPSNAFTAVPGFDPALVWATPPHASVDWDRTATVTPTSSGIPEVGGTRFWVITFPPDSVMTAPSFDLVAAGAEYGERLPGLAAQFEVDSPGMHRTDTIDYDIVIDGEITLDLDDGEVRTLCRGDLVVQHGVRHAWRNRTSKPATIVAVMIGATRQGRSAKT